MSKKTKVWLFLLAAVLAIVLLWPRSKGLQKQEEYIFKKQYVSKRWILYPEKDKEFNLKLGKRGNQEEQYFALRCRERVIIQYHEEDCEPRSFIFDTGTHFFGCLGQSRFLKIETCYLSLTPEFAKFKNQVVLEILRPVDLDKVFEHIHFDFFKSRGVHIRSNEDKAIYPTERFMLSGKRDLFPLFSWCYTGIPIFKTDLVFVATNDSSQVSIRLGPKIYEVEKGRDFFKPSVGAIDFWRFRALKVNGEIYLKSNVVNFGCIHILRGVLQEGGE